MDADEELLFDDEPAPSSAPGAMPGSSLPSWKVLIVDDDEQVHAITRVVLRGLHYLSRPVELVSAMSAAEARRILASGAEFALAVIDVVMETQHSGLDLVRHIRHEAGQRAIRLILRTGQPGHAPESDVIINYEIDDYKSKTELTAQKLVTAVIASLRAYAYITEIADLNRNLENLVAMRTAELERLAMLDPLTGAGNRRHLDQRAAVEVQRWREGGIALGVLVFDIDFFKKVNDGYGHAAGDAVLCEVVQRAKAALRADDFLARIGGEEFVVLLPAHTAAQSVAVAERIRSSIGGAAMSIPTGTLAITTSVGVAALGRDGSIEQAIERADAALYQAKQGGRNRVVCADGAT
jgi:diguanylate cyclase (GGDEF)-like protein